MHKINVSDQICRNKHQITIDQMKIAIIYIIRTQSVTFSDGNVIFLINCLMDKLIINFGNSVFT